VPVESDYAWAAGFIDGEGTFSITKHVNGVNSYKPHLAVSQVDRRPLDRLQVLFGGHVKSMRSRHPNQSDYWRWGLASAQAFRELLPHLLPWLIVKREEAEIVLDFCKLVGPKGRWVIPDEVSQARSALVEELREVRAPKVVRHVSG
jgi:hypothetical protein